MFQKRSGQSYATYNNINLNSIDYKYYDLEKALITNEHDVLELQFNLTDVALLGSEESFKKTEEVINTLRVTFDKEALEEHSLVQCMENTACKSKVKESEANILNYMYEIAYADINSVSMTNEEWDQAYLKAESYSDIAKNKSSIAWFKLQD